MASVVSEPGRAQRKPAPSIYKALRIFFKRAYLPLWLRKTGGKVLPPFSGTSKMRSVYVVTYGRSGSTLITGYLSRLPGFNLRGENCLFPYFAYKTEKHIHVTRRLNFTNSNNQSHPWYGQNHLNSKRFNSDFKNIFLNQLYPNMFIPKTIGFKEIRYHKLVEDSDFAPMLDWLRELRAPGAIVFMFRDLDKVMTSGWWAKLKPEEAAQTRKKLEHFERQSRDYAAANPDNSIIVTYERFTTDETMPREICDLLGVKFSEQVWQDTLGTEFSWKTNQPSS
jgi:hypothetical protein